MNNAQQHNMDLYMNAKLETEIDVERIVCYLSFDMEWDYPDFTEKHDFWEMLYVESGAGFAHVDSEKVRLHSGEVYFHKPGEAHTFHPDENTIAHICCISFFSRSDAMQLFENLKFSLNHHQKNLLKKLDAEGHKAFDTIYYKVNNQTSFFMPSDSPPLGGLQMCKIYLESFLITIARNASEKFKSENKESKDAIETETVRDITEIISESVYSDFNIEILCEKLNYSRTYLSTLFKKHKDISIINYYNYLKIQEAKRLIRDTEFSLNKIAEMLKFNNQYYFSRVFKKIENASPSEYKKKVRSAE